MVGVVFATLAATTAHLTINQRLANAITGAALGIAFAARAVGDSQDLRWLSRMSPIGWAQATQPFGSDNWLPLALGLTVAALIAAASLRLAGLRDVGRSLLPSRSGPARGSAALGTPLGSAIRSQRAATLAWLAGITAYGSVFGLAGVDIVDAADSSPTLADYLADGNGTIAENYLGTVALMLAVLTTGYVVQQLLRLTEDETTGRADLILTTSTSRRTWTLSRIAVTLAGSIVILAGSGLTVGLIHGLRVDRPLWALDIAGAEMTYLPAIWTIAAIAILIHGIAPRRVSTAWGILGVAAAITLIGEPTGLPDPILALSPFTHLPALPAETSRPASSITMLLAVVCVITASSWQVQRRDILNR